MSEYVTNEEYKHDDSSLTSGKSIYTLENLPAGMSDSAVFNLLYNFKRGDFTPSGVQSADDTYGWWLKGQAEVIRVNDKPVQVIQSRWINTKK